MSARLAIVIVNYNTRDWLSQCLHALYAQDIAEEVEIVVVDSASTDDSIDMVRRDFPGCTLIASKENLGFGRGNNLGAAQSTAPILLFLNPDTRVIDGALAELLLFMDRHPPVRSSRWANLRWRGRTGTFGGNMADAFEPDFRPSPVTLSITLRAIRTPGPSLLGLRKAARGWLGDWRLFVYSPRSV